MNNWELQEEKIEAQLWGRPMRTFIKDIPGPYFGVVPEPLVNFDIGIKKFKAH